MKSEGVVPFRDKQECNFVDQLAQKQESGERVLVVTKDGNLYYGTVTHVTDMSVAVAESCISVRDIHYVT